MTARRIVLIAASIAAIVGVNFFLCRNLFYVEYTGHMNSVQGLWISMARLAGEHWFRPSWWPYQDAGVPFEHTYMPLVAAAAAMVSKMAHLSAARALNIVMALVLCLGPASLFVMIWRISGRAGAAFWACLAYSVTSPARALLPEGDINPVRYWSSLRIYGTVVWDDLPHHAAMSLLPLALLFLWRALETRRSGHCVLAIVFMSLTVLASVFGATALLLGAACLLAAFPRKGLHENVRLTAVIAGAAYLIASPFLPPSLIATIRANQQRFVEDQWSAGSLTALSLVVLGWIVIVRTLDRGGAARDTRFFVLFAFAGAAIPMLDAYLGRHFIPQPNRYTAEMEIGIAFVSVPLIGWCAARLPSRIRMAIAVFLLCVAIEHIGRLRHFVAQNTSPVDIARGIEFRAAKWLDGHVPGQRVMVAGSIAQWLNVFSDTPQLSGASYSTTPNWTQQEAMNRLLTSSTPRETGEAVLWAKAFGVQAVTACGRNSPQFWKGISSTKFDGQLPVLWREQDTTIYGVPQRSSSLAHVIPEAALAQRNARGALPLENLQRYVDALEDVALPIARMEWHGFRRISILANVARGQVVSVQTGYHRGWHAQANGQRVEIRPDGLGFLVVLPQCSGRCAIELTYDGGWEYLLCRGMSCLTLLTMAGIVLRRS